MVLQRKYIIVVKGTDYISALNPLVLLNSNKYALNLLKIVLEDREKVTLEILSSLITIII